MAHNEFVRVVQGRAGVRLENEADVVVLGSGGYLQVGAHVKHRLDWTDPSVDTIWLPVHY